MFVKKGPGLLEQNIKILYAKGKIRLDTKQKEEVTLDRIISETERNQCNVAIDGSSLGGIDCDTLDKKAAAFMVVGICNIIGVHPSKLIQRFGKRPKFLIPFVLTGKMTSYASEVYIDDDGKKHQLEYKLKGTYWIAHGHYRNSKNKKITYVYQVGRDVVEDFTLIVDELPIISVFQLEQIKVLWGECAEKFGWENLKTGHGGRTDSGDDWDIEDERMIDMPIEKMRYYLNATDESEWEDYHSFLNLGMAIHHQTEGSDKGLELYIECCERLDDEIFDEQECIDKWESFNNNDD